MNKKGFTLIEIIAVVTIVSILSLLAITSVINQLNKSKNDMSNVMKEVIYSATNLYVEHKEETFVRYNGNTYCITLKNLVDNNYLNSPVLDPKTGKEIDINTKIKGVFINNMFNFNIDNNCTEVIVGPPKEVFDKKKGVNRPQLTTGMTPIKWDVSNNEIDTTENDSEWYDYSTKKWANAKTKDGSYWVWIPRYAYKMNGQYHNGGAGISSSFDIKFLKNNTNEPTDSTVIEIEGYDADNKNTLNNYFLHPAFQNDMNEYGFWVAKFEPSVANQSDPCYTNASEANCNKTDLTVKIIPNAKSWRYIIIGNMFTVSKNMKDNSTYGWNSLKVDTHMMTNYEWGAVTYLSASEHGKNTEVWINPSSDYITGCAGTESSVDSSSGCSYEYNTSNGGQASTTGNITGIYDMSGGSNECVSAYIDNGHSYLTTYGSSIINETDIKYKNVYTKSTQDDRSNNYIANKNIYGDAVWETSNAGEGSTSWNGDNSYMPYTSYPFFLRGGYYSYASMAGLFFFTGGAGFAYGGYSFRPVFALKP